MADKIETRRHLNKIIEISIILNLNQIWIE
jgi:hypothetical protein